MLYISGKQRLVRLDVKNKIGVRDLGIGYQWCLAKYGNGTSSLIDYITCILSSSTRVRCSVYGTSRIYSTPVQVRPRHCSTGYSAGLFPAHALAIITRGSVRRAG